MNVNLFFVVQKFEKGGLVKLNWRYFVSKASLLVLSEFSRSTAGKTLRTGKVVKVRTKKGKVWVTLVHLTKTYVYLFQTRDTWVFRTQSGDLFLKRQRKGESIGTTCSFALANPFPAREES
jgi:hypothetical protein